MVLRKQEVSATTYFWELVRNVTAYYLEAYGKPAATLFDSTSVSTEYHYFQVIAHMTTLTIFFISDPDSGYSVDNLAPAAPAALAGRQPVTPIGLALEWRRNTEGDLSHYATYRGTDEAFVPARGNLVAEVTDTTYFDSAWRWDSGYYYKISAVDVHENESAFSLLRPEDVTGSGGPGRIAASYLGENYPNPFDPTTTFPFGLGEAGHVTLGIYDARGR